MRVFASLDEFAGAADGQQWIHTDPDRASTGLTGALPGRKPVG